LAKHKKINDQWKWESLTHMGFSVEGAVIGGSITPNLISTLPYYGTTIFASQQLKYTLTFALVCKGFPLSYTTDVITSEGIFQL
jgi:hypothetical protein